MLRNGLTRNEGYENFKIKSQKKSQKFWRIIFLTYLCTRNPIETTTPQGCKVHKHPGGVNKTSRIKVRDSRNGKFVM